MSYLTENDKRSFAYKMIQILHDNAAALTAAGYDAGNKVSELQNQASEADEAESAQETAEIAYKLAVKNADDKLDAYYKNASASVELIAGLLGKDHPLVLELRDLRKNHRSSTTTK